ncbi:MAG: flagellar basal-body rod protein FlgG [Gammaproteobacteria bacterium]
MIPALWIAKTGLDANQTSVSVTAHNLANVETAGFKKGQGVFADTLYQKIRQPGAQSTATSELPSGLMLGTGVKVIATQKDFAPGNLQRTNNAFDMAINGRGFFKITRSDGTTAYTRAGKFSPDSTGAIVNLEGNKLDPALTVPPGALSFTVGNDGTVSVLVTGSTTPTTLGQIQLADFINPAGLEPIGDNLFLETQASGTPQSGVPGNNGLGSLEQNNLESSNVNIVEEMVNLIQHQRAYETNARTIETADDMMRFLVQTI